MSGFNQYGMRGTGGGGNTLGDSNSEYYNGRLRISDL
jgi:hypothetical protein